MKPDEALNRITVIEVRGRYNINEIRELVSLAHEGWKLVEERNERIKSLTLDIKAERGRHCRSLEELSDLERQLEEAKQVIRDLTGLRGGERYFFNSRTKSKQ